MVLLDFVNGKRGVGRSTWRVTGGEVYHRPIADVLLHRADFYERGNAISVPERSVPTREFEGKLIGISGRVACDKNVPR